MMSAILRDESLISPIVTTTPATTWPPRSATLLADAASWLAWRAESADCRTVPVSCSIDEAVCCRLEAVCSVRLLRSWLPAAISVLAVVMLSVERRTSITRPCRRCRISPMAAIMWPSSSWRAAGTGVARSPPAMRRIDDSTSRSGFSSARIVSQAVSASPSRHTSAVTRPTASSARLDSTAPS